MILVFVFCFAFPEDGRGLCSLPRADSGTFVALRFAGFGFFGFLTYALTRAPFLWGGFLGAGGFGSGLFRFRGFFSIGW